MPSEISQKWNLIKVTNEYNTKKTDLENKTSGYKCEEGRERGKRTMGHECTNYHV